MAARGLSGGDLGRPLRGGHLGHEEEASVLFADLQGFTGSPSTHGESQVTAMLDAYFDAGIPRCAWTKRATSARSGTR